MGAGENLRVLSPGRLVATTLLAAVVALVICLAICQTAHAHATLTGTVPADGAVLQAPPDAVILSFNEAATPIVASLVLPGGNISELQQFSTSGATISIALLKTPPSPLCDAQPHTLSDNAKANVPKPR